MAQCYTVIPNNSPNPMLYLPTEFPQDPTLNYLNHAAVSPWPKRTATAVQSFAFENMQIGAENYPKWLDKAQRLRERLAWLINAPSSDDIALIKNTSEGLSFVANGVDWQPGDEIVGIIDDFPSNRMPWETLQNKGVTYRTIDTNASDDPEAALIAATNANTRLMAISSVHFSTGIRLDIAKLAHHCQANNILLCLDAIQSLGAVAFDVQATPVDFLIADGHKWMLGPEGLGIFYVNPALRNQLKLTQYGWAMRADPSDYSTADWQIADTARRFECGSPNMLSIHALEASISLLQEIGFAEIEQRLRHNIQQLRTGLSKIPDCEIRTPNETKRSAGILSFRINGKNSLAMYKMLMQERVICACRGNYVRFSPHFYTSEQVLENALAKLIAIYPKA